MLNKFSIFLHSPCSWLLTSVCRAMAASTLTGISLSSIRFCLTSSTAFLSTSSSWKRSGLKQCSTQHDCQSTESRGTGLTEKDRAGSESKLLSFQKKELRRAPLVRTGTALALLLALQLELRQTHIKLDIRSALF